MVTGIYNLIKFHQISQQLTITSIL